MQQRIGYYLLRAVLLALFLPVYARAQDETKPLYGLLLDNSGSIEKQLPLVLALGEGIVRRVHSRGSVAVFTVMPDPNTVNKAASAPGIVWSQDEKALSERLSAVRVLRGSSPTVLDALSSVAVELVAKSKNEAAPPAAKTIILISDGYFRIGYPASAGGTGPNYEEDERRKLERQLVRSLKESGVKVYAVGLVSELSAEGGFSRKSPRENAENFLKKITKETGGRVVFPPAKNWDFDKLLDELLAQ